MLKRRQKDLDICLDPRLQPVVSEVIRQLTLWVDGQKTGSLTFEVHFKEGSLPTKNIRVASNESVLLIKT